MDNSN